jgi:hypothetical protein
MYKLESVGCYIEKTTGNTYPINSDGTPDLMSDVFIDDCSDEWLEALSSKDKLIVKKVIEQL